MLRAPFRHIVWAEVLFIASLSLLWLSDRSRLLAAFFSPDIPFGDGLLLVLLVLGALSFLGLLVLIPWACVVIFKSPDGPMSPRLVLTALGLGEILLLGIWLARIVWK